MTDSDMDFTEPMVRGAEDRVFRSPRSYVHRRLGAFIALACCAVLATVWRVSADENHRAAIAAVRALERATSSTEQVEAIRDLVRPVVIDGQVVIPPLIITLAHPVVEVRVEAVRSLGPATSAAATIGSAEDVVTNAVAALTNSLDDPEPAVRIAAAQSLGAIAASNNPTGMIHPQTLVDALTAMLDDSDATVRASTIAAMGMAGPAAGSEPPRALIAALDDESGFNRAAAVSALARFSTKSGD